jgi:hypothetical protein
MGMTHVDIEFSKDIWHNIIEVGEWLDEYMPNPPDDEQPRWFIANGQDDRWGIRFYNEDDAALYLLRWGTR